MISVFRKSGKPPRRASFRASVTGLEGRVQLSTTSITPAVLPAVHVQALAPAAPTINAKVVAFLTKELGQRVGGGECANLATEALRVSGAKFANIAPDAPNPGDYVWGSLVKTISVNNGKWTDSSPTAAVQPGDVIQYRNATFSDGSVATHHTSIVATVNAKGQPTSVFEQNITTAGSTTSNRADTLEPIDVTKLTGGFLRIYQPVARTPQAGVYQITVVNNTATSQSVAVYFGGTADGSIPFTPANTASSYLTLSVTASVAPTLRIGAQSITTVDGAGYEIFTSAGTTSIRKLVP